MKITPTIMNPMTHHLNNFQKSESNPKPSPSNSSKQVTNRPMSPARNKPVPKTSKQIILINSFLQLQKVSDSNGCAEF